MGGGTVGGQSTEELAEKELGKLKEQVQKEGKVSCRNWNSKHFGFFVNLLLYFVLQRLYKLCHRSDI